MTKEELIEKFAYGSSKMGKNGKKAIEMIFIDGLNQTEVAKALGLAIPTVSRYVKSFKRLG